MSRYPLIFSAPKGWGKTRHAEELRKQYCCNMVVDDWKPGDPLVPGALHLTSARPNSVFLEGVARYSYRLISHGWVRPAQIRMSA